MTTVADFGEYTGMFGTITIGGVALADVEFDCKWSRGTVSHARGGKYSDIQIPGKLTVKTKIKKALVYADAPKTLGYSLNDTPITGTAEALLAASSVLDATDFYIDMTDATIATESLIKITLQTKNITTGGTITLIGENTAGVAISEIIDLPATAVVGATWTSTKTFKVLYGMTVRGTDSTDDTGTFKVESIAGNTSFTVGNPKVFDLIGTLTKGATTIVVTLPDCWFSSGNLNWSDASKIIDVDADVEMHDPDLLKVDIT